jgi:MFS family permease
MNPARLQRSPVTERSKGQLVEGLRYAAGKPAILFTLIVLGAAAMFAYTMPVLLSAYADNVFHVGASGYGVFNALVAAGALTGAIASTRRLNLRLRTVIVSAVALGVVQLLAGVVPGLWLFALFITGTGVVSLLFLTGANSLVQSSSNIGIRGRVMSLYILVQLGGQAIGGPIMGWIIEQFGAPVGMVVSGAVPLTVALVAGIVLARRSGLRLRVARAGRMPRLVIESQLA